MSYVYFIECSGYVKIGFSYRPEHRMQSLFASGKLLRPADMDIAKERTLLHTIPDCLIKDERRLHAVFAEYHETGEWFRATPMFYRDLLALDYETITQERARLRRERRQAKEAVA